MKKFFAILVTMALLVSSVCIALPSSAADGAAAYTVTVDADYAAKKVSVTVEMTENSGLSCCIIDLTYDAAVLTCTSAAAGSVWSGDVEANTATDGVVIFYAVPDNMNAVNTATGVIFTAEFELKSGASEDAPFNFALVCGQNDEYNHAVVENGDFIPVALNATVTGDATLADAKPVIPAPEATKFSLTSEVVDGKYLVYCDVADNAGFWALIMNVDYNAAALSAPTLVAGDTFTATELAYSNVAGKPAVIFYESSVLGNNTANGRAFTLEFTIADCSKAPEVTAEISELINFDGDDVEFAVTENYAALEHKIADGAAPDCTNGVNCLVCGTEVIPANGHTEVPVAGTPADCENDGLTDGVKCDVCGEWVVPQVTDPAKGHTPKEAVKENVVAPDCDDDGSYEEVVYCDVCGDELSRKNKVDPATGHTPGDVVVENATGAVCTAGGSYEEVIYCTVCGDEISRTVVDVPALGHTDGEVVIENTVAPDCDTDGSHDEVVYCTVCGEELSRDTKVDPATGHTEEAMPGYAAGCTTEGLTDGVKCSVCGDILTPQETIPAKGHTPAAAVKENVTPATCTVDGSYEEVVYCDVCGDELSREAKVDPAKGHTPAEAVKENVVAADCENDGSYEEVVYCSVCGDELSREAKVEPAKGHTPAAAVKENVVAADCVTDGSYEEVVYCDVCGDELSRDAKVEPALGHTPGEAVKENVVDADCDDYGSYDEVHYCTVCGKELSRVVKEIIPYDHTEEEIPAVAPSCTETGLTAGSKCSVCGETLVAQEEVPATGHTEETIPAVEPGCETTGLTEGTKCSVCGEVLVAQEEVGALGHLPEEELTLVPGTPATEDAEGVTDALVCGRCDTVISGGEVIEKLPANEEEKEPEKDPVTPPQTGDNMTFIIIIAVVAAVACVVLVVYSKKRAAKASK